MPEVVKNHGGTVGQIAAVSVNSPQRRGFITVEQQLPTWTPKIFAIGKVVQAIDIGKTIHPPPTLDRSIGMAAEGRMVSSPTCRR